MGWEILLWAIPGYFALLLYHRKKEIPHKGTWDFFVKIAPFSLATFVLSHMMVRLLTRYLPPWASETFVSFNAILGYDLSLQFVLALIPCARLTVMGAALIKWYYGFEKERPLLTKTLDALMDKPGVIHLKNRKVYVGALIGFDSPDDPKYLQVTPYISGFRDPSTLQVTYDTNYFLAMSEGDLPNRDMVIPMSEISSLSRFDMKMHNAFVADGRTLIRYKKAPLPDAPPERSDSEIAIQPGR